MPDRDQQLTGTMKLFALFIKCPFGASTRNCPFTAIRDGIRCLENRFDLAMEMAANDEKAKELWWSHICCYQQRMAEINGRVSTRQRRRQQRELHASC